MRKREPISDFLFQLMWSPILLLTRMKMYGACACVFGLTPDGSRCRRLHTLSPSTPWSPSRLSGRAADRLSDEMMTLLWEVILKWKVSGKDCAPSHTCHSISPPVSLPAVWIMIDLFQIARTHWFSSVLSKKKNNNKKKLNKTKYITYLQLYHWGMDPTYPASF